jgi:hypothetical protein
MKVSLDHGARLNQIVELAARNSLPVMGFGREVLDSTPRVARTLLRRGDFGPAYVSSRSIATGGQDYRSSHVRCSPIATEVVSR